MSSCGPFLDVQVNGYAGVDFNCVDALSLKDMQRACVRMKADGVHGCLVTVISDTLDKMAARLRILAQWISTDPLVAEVVVGLHVEGPFLNPHKGFCGCHPVCSLQAATPEAADVLLDAAAGWVRLFTLAPERDCPSFSTIHHLSRRGVIVSAGHTDASLAQLEQAADAGLRCLTHLGNGCPALLPRHDNFIQRGLNLARRGLLTPCFVGDGIHIPPFVLSNYLATTGRTHAIIVTDAMSAAGLPPGRYPFGSWEVEVGEDRAARAPGGDHLVGSAATMLDCARILREEVGLDSGSIRSLTWENPRRLLGL